jgi:hypothetical protein
MGKQSNMARPKVHKYPIAQPKNIEMVEMPKNSKICFNLFSCYWGTELRQALYCLSFASSPKV